MDPDPEPESEQPITFTNPAQKKQRYMQKDAVNRRIKQLYVNDKQNQCTFSEPFPLALEDCLDSELDKEASYDPKQRQADLLPDEMTICVYPQSQDADGAFVRVTHVSLERIEDFFKQTQVLAYAATAAIATLEEANEELLQKRVFQQT